MLRVEKSSPANRIRLGANYFLNKIMVITSHSILVERAISVVGAFAPVDGGFGGVRRWPGSVFRSEREYDFAPASR